MTKRRSRLHPMLPIIRKWLWLVVASSFVVFVEPAASDLLIIGLFVVAFAGGLHVPRKLGVPLVLLGLFLLGNLVASSVSAEPFASLMPLAIRTYLVFCWWLLVAGLLSNDPEATMRILWQGYSIAAILATAIGTLAFFTVIPDFGQLLEFGRVRSLFKDANVYGPFLIPPILYALHRLEESAGVRAIFFYLVFAFLCFGLLLGFSRGSWLNFAVALGTYLLLRLRSRRDSQKRRRLLLAAAGIAAAAAALVVFTTLNSQLGDMLEQRARVIQSYDVGSERTQSLGRFGAQLEYLQIAMTRPLGIGAGQTANSTFPGVAPHNLYLHVLVEAGWIGALAFFAFLLLTLAYAVRVMAASHAATGAYQVVVACVIGVLVQSLFVDSTHWRHFYLLMAMIWGATPPSMPRVTGAGRL